MSEVIIKEVLYNAMLYYTKPGGEGLSLLRQAFLSLHSSAEDPRQVDLGYAFREAAHQTAKDIASESLDWINYKNGIVRIVHNERSIA